MSSLPSIWWVEVYFIIKPRSSVYKTICTDGVLQALESGHNKLVKNDSTFL